MTKTKNSITVRAVCVQGHHHSIKGLACQDYCRHFIGKDKFIGVISDGAGSAKYGKIGARIVCDTMVDLLAKSSFSQAKKHILNAVRIARDKAVFHRYNKTKNESGLNDFAATLVGAFYHKGKGLFFHIGDGAALALKDNTLHDFIISRPENGLFSCETFFYTMNDWEASLRFTSFENAHSVFLMSDGLTSFAFTNNFERLENGFIAPIHDFLCKEKNKSKALKALNNTLNTEKAQRLNSDDKTLLWARL